MAESLSVPDFVNMMNHAGAGGVNTQGKVIDSITEDQQEYYGFDQADFPEASSDGRVMLLLSYP